jgi:signal transduction histidine kinase/CheY-like chemotaxis protein
MKLRASASQLARLFPSYILVDNSLSVTATGPSVQRRFPSLEIGSKLEDHFGPAGTMRGSRLQDHIFQSNPFAIAEHSSGSELQGEAIECETGYFLALRIAPDQYLKTGSSLEISDFTTADPAVHGLLLFGLQQALLEDQRQAAHDQVIERQKSIDLLDRISRISAYIAHDFNNILSIIRLNCARLTRHFDKESTSLRLIEIISDSTMRGSAITRSFMTLSNESDATKMPICVDAVLREGVPLFESMVGSGNETVVRLAAGDAQIASGSTALTNCIINLLINARDAIVGGDRVYITTWTENAAARPDTISNASWSGIVIIEIADSGHGMKNEVLSRAFEPHFSTKPSGNGLGLASVLEFARQCGGDAYVESTEGEGTRIRLLLPMLEPVATPTNVGDLMREDRADPRARGCQTHLLVVDDEPYALEALAELLELEGYGVTPCKSAADALAALASKPYQVLLTDIVMPGESGVTLARTAQILQPGIKIILMSGYVPNGEDISSEWMFIRKPITTDHLSDLLRSRV